MIEVGGGIDLTLPCMTIKMASNRDLGLDLWSFAATILRYSSSAFPLYYYHCETLQCDDVKANT